MMPHPAPTSSSPQDRELVLGQFGLVPHWAKDRQIARHTVNARSETVATKPSFRDPWRRGRRCIVPAAAFWEPDWRSGKSVPTRIGRADRRPMGLAALWDAWQPPEGPLLHSFTLLTMNADHHPLMSQFHRPTAEKRMLIILPEEAYAPWLTASPEESRAFLTAFPAEGLSVHPEDPSR